MNGIIRNSTIKTSKDEKDTSTNNNEETNNVEKINEETKNIEKINGESNNVEKINGKTNIENNEEADKDSSCDRETLDEIKADVEPHYKETTNDDENSPKDESNYVEINKKKSKNFINSIKEKTASKIYAQVVKLTKSEKDENEKNNDIRNNTHAKEDNNCINTSNVTNNISKIRTNNNDKMTERLKRMTMKDEDVMTSLGASSYLICF